MPFVMHKIQYDLMSLAAHTDLNKLSLRKIASLIGIDGKPQLIKHHLEQLAKLGIYLKENNKLSPESGEILMNLCKNISALSDRDKKTIKKILNKYDYVSIIKQ